MAVANEAAFESRAVVAEYRSAQELQKPEQTLLSLLKDDLGGMRMLDVGVGAGRTTLHFSPRAKEYVGVDISRRMIEACQERFPANPKLSFKVADARALLDFPAGSFDFVLFSFNGLDTLDHPDRIQALKEIQRVLKHDSFFAFSSHNVHSVASLYTLRYCINPVRLSKQMLRQLLLRVINGSPQRLMRQKRVVIRDGSHRFRVRNYYITPDAQLEQLNELGFKNARVFSLETGNEVNPSQVGALTDSWVYFLCNR